MQVMRARAGFEPSWSGPSRYQSRNGGVLHTGSHAQGRLRPKPDRKFFAVPQLRRPENRTTPLEVARLVVWSRDPGSRN